MLGIIGAMEIETEGLIQRLSERKDISIGAYKYVCGKLCGKEIVVCKCGIGKVFSSTAAALMILRFGVTHIINIGVAGGVKPLCQGDIVISERTVQHDYDGTADGLVLGQVHGFESPYFECDRIIVNKLCEIITKLGYNHKVGTIASGDCFVSDNIKSSFIADKFGAVAFDMESAAINQVCEVQKVGFVSIRAISDNGDDSAVKSFYEFVTEASERSIKIVTEFITLFG